MIKILNEDTCPDIDHWEGHPCIPMRVFGPKQYLIVPLLELSKPKVTSRPLPAASGGSVLTNHQPQSELGSFKATKTPRYGRSSEPKVHEDTAKKQFMAWFDTAFANLDPRVKHKALLASRDATSAIIAEARRESEEQARSSDRTRSVDQPKATHGHSTTRTEYWVETADIRVVREHESSGKQDSNETSS